MWKTTKLLETGSDPQGPSTALHGISSSMAVFNWGIPYGVLKLSLGT